MMKRSNSRLNSIFKGMKMIYMPVFYSQSKKTIEFDLDMRSDKVKLQSDYRKSTKEISKGVREFELLHRK